MATSSHPSMASQSASTQVIAHSALKVAQAFSTIVPPAYLVTSLILRRGRGFSVRGLATTSFGGVVAGAGIGGVAAWGRLRDQPIEAIEDRAFRLAHNASQIRTDDYSVMGATLAGLIVPALFLKRAPLPLLVLGGASIGLGLGVDAHLIKSFQEGKQVKPEGMVGELPVVGGNK